MQAATGDEGLILATAGHIDHGKTTLVGALTGTDTDRLPEEKARGISIDLGFAHMDLPPPLRGRIAFVDVPGHERFLRNMLAGVGGAGAALLAVAADDGVMPQTREHLEILDLLGIPGAAVAITKCDRVAAPRLAEVTRDVAALVARTSLAGAPVVPTAAPSGQGIAALRDALVDAARRHAGAAGALAGEPVRFVVDRAFTVAGSGSVVTGTVLRGAVAPGDSLLLAPRGHPVRVRGVQVAGAAVPRAGAGQRCALNLAGIERAELGRGDWLLPPALHRPTARLDVELRAAPSAGTGLAHWTPCILHLGAAAVPGRLRLRRGAAIGPGADGVAQLVLDASVVALAGERFVLRDPAGRRTLAGGRILDPFAPSRARPGRVAELSALREPDPALALRALLAARPEGIDPSPFAAARNLDAPTLDAALARAGAVLLGRPPRCLARTALDAVRARIAARLREGGAGVAAETLRRAAAPPGLPPAAFAALLRAMAAEGALDLSAGGVVRLPEAARQATLARRDGRHALLEELERIGRDGVAAADAGRLLHAPPAFLLALLDGLRRDGLAHQVAGRWYAAAAMDGLAEVAARLAAARPGGFTAAEFRDAAGIGRNRTIEVLEHLDAVGVTRREGAVRRLSPRAAHHPAGAGHAE
ncbi:selenocysteine-specific translation elongation factor [Falsiroseomonas sp. CW058]|uniref:selenocysteine-specific translation elongation factor n=1 Tax=Falsiroseomonas sp. CW058 TaxID=3388664 RepID=UPI003D317E4F